MCSASKGKWSDCGNVDYSFNYDSELPNYRDWVAKGDLQILIYNGDADYILSHAGNEAWITKGLNISASSPWTKWRGSDGQVAGYFETFATGNPTQNFTFLTVKGAGHMVPKDRPRHALDMLARFLEGGEYEKVEKAAEAPCAVSVGGRVYVLITASVPGSINRSPARSPARARCASSSSAARCPPPAPPASPTSPRRQHGARAVPLPHLRAHLLLGVRVVGRALQVAQTCAARRCAGGGARGRRRVPCGLNGCSTRASSRSAACTAEIEEQPLARRLPRVAAQRVLLAALVDGGDDGDAVERRRARADAALAHRETHDAAAHRALEEGSLSHSSSFARGTRIRSSASSGAGGPPAARPSSLPDTSTTSPPRPPRPPRPSSRRSAADTKSSYCTPPSSSSSSTYSSPPPASPSLPTPSSPTTNVVAALPALALRRELAIPEIRSTPRFAADRPDRRPGAIASSAPPPRAGRAGRPVAAPSPLVAHQPCGVRLGAAAVALALEVAEIHGSAGAGEGRVRGGEEHGGEAGGDSRSLAPTRIREKAARWNHPKNGNPLFKVGQGSAPACGSSTGDRAAMPAAPSLRKTTARTASIRLHAAPRDGRARRRRPRAPSSGAAARRPQKPSPVDGAIAVRPQRLPPQAGRRQPRVEVVVRAARPRPAAALPRGFAQLDRAEADRPRRRPGGCAARGGRAQRPRRLRLRRVGRPPKEGSTAAGASQQQAR